MLMKAAVELLEDRRLLTGAAARAGCLECELAETVQPVLHASDVHTRGRDIWGADNRLPVPDNEQYPFSAVGRIESVWPDGSATFGSGVLIDSYHFLTAAHVVYDEASRQFAEEVYVTPALEDLAAPYGVAAATYLRIDWRYREYGTQDYALVTLDRRIGRRTGWFGYAAFSSYELEGRKVRSAGYPGDRGGGDEMYYQVGRALRVIGAMIYTRLDIARGQSGSPVYAPGRGGPLVVGVLVSSDRYYAYATQITPRILENLSQWIAQDDVRRAPKSATARAVAVDGWLVWMMRLADDSSGAKGMAIPAGLFSSTRLEDYWGSAGTPVFSDGPVQ